MEIVVETNSNYKPDPRLVFLERTSARLTLVEAGAMEIEDVFNGLVDQCACEREMIARWDYPPQPRAKAAKPERRRVDHL